MQKLACSAVFVCFNYSTSFSKTDFPSFWNLTKEARLLKNDILTSKIKIRCSLAMLSPQKKIYTGGMLVPASTSR